MSFQDNINKYENIHIAFWLVKDTCWMLELKVLGTLMMIPTLFFALFIVYKTWNQSAMWINAAVFCWIFANSYWMMSEFYADSHYKQFAAIPFGLGLICSLLFVIKSYNTKEQNEEPKNHV
jgi:hypothetical protein